MCWGNFRSADCVSVRRWVCAVLGPARHSLARVHKLPDNFGPSAGVVQAISISWRWSSPGAHHILGRCDWCQFVELLLQHIQDFRPRRNRSVAGTIWSNRAVSKLSRSGRNICRPVEVYFHDRAPRSEDTAKAAARQREKIWGLITSPRRFRSRENLGCDHVNLGPRQCLDALGQTSRLGAL